MKFAADTNALFIVVLASHLHGSLEILTDIIIGPLIAPNR